ncbi:MAG: DUF1207 domain-containing protein [Deferribacteraceae bacterium]|jgi:hypothetical protein|nr:DUF1207 domain-containing protein [Deferribacteraceae bacterium]
MRKLLTISIIFVFVSVGQAFDGSRYTLGDNWNLFPYESIFKPLMADPEWARMGVGYRHYTSAPYVLENALDFTLGGTIPVIRKDFGGVEAELGLQGLGLLGFDLDDNTNMIYGDFFLGAPLFLKFSEEFMVMARYYHRSSHIGDEAVLNAAKADVGSERYGLERINLSYEVLDVVLSYQITDQIRVYGGGGVVSDPQPHEYGMTVYQLGAEVEQPISNGVNLICAADFKGTAGVAPGISIKAGAKLFDRAILSFDFFDGPGPAQFFDERVTSYGLNLNIQ